jgi:hypothetical protein
MNTSKQATRAKDFAAADRLYEPPASTLMRPGTLMIGEVFANGCEHRDAQVIAFLRARLRQHYGTTGLRAKEIKWVIDRLERGEHVK